MHYSFQSTHTKRKFLVAESTLSAEDTENDGQIDMPFFATEEGRYLASCKYFQEVAAILNNRVAAYSDQIASKL